MLSHVHAMCGCVGAVPFRAEAWQHNARAYRHHNDLRNTCDFGLQQSSAMSHDGGCHRVATRLAPQYYVTPGIDVRAAVARWHAERRANPKYKLIQVQEEFLEHLSEHLITESNEWADAPSSTTAPPLYYVTGPPGTGKTFVTRSIQSLAAALGWTNGVEYQFVAFMASTARQIDGLSPHPLPSACCGTHPQHFALCRHDDPSRVWHQPIHKRVRCTHHGDEPTSDLSDRRGQHGRS